MDAAFQPPPVAQISWNPISYRSRQMRSLPFHLSAASASQSDRWSWSSGASSAFEARPHRDGSFSSLESEDEVQGRQLPTWACDDFDLEDGSAPWKPHGWGPKIGFFRRGLYRSRIEKKMRDPSSDSVIHYRMRPKQSYWRQCLRFMCFFGVSVIIGIFHNRIGLSCGSDPTESEVDLLPSPSFLPPAPRDSSEESKSSPQTNHALLYLVLPVAAIGLAGQILFTHGRGNVHACRLVLEKVRSVGITLAYSLLKTTAVNNPAGPDGEALQLVLYECLALVTAYPVALLQQLYGNTCEPDVTNYCHDIAITYKRMREGGIQLARRPLLEKRLRQRKQFVTVDHFFEIFSLQLEKEFRCQSARTETPSMVPQHIVYNLRSHFENLVDREWVDDRKAPMLRENIDLLGWHGRECSMYSLYDVFPIYLLWVWTTITYMFIICTPVMQCEFFATHTPPSPETPLPIPTVSTFIHAALLSFICVVVLILVDEVRGFWNPYGRGINMFAWSLSMAMEIDLMVNEFYERDETALLRPHSYVARDRERDGEGVGSGRFQRGGLRTLLKRAMTV